jgi:hypothetical protein
VVHLASKHINTRVIPLPVRPTGHLTVLESQSPKELGLDLGSSKGCERPRGSVDHLSDPHPPYSSKGGPQGLPGPGRGIGVQTVSTISRLALFRYQRQGVCENLPLYQMGCWARGVCPGGWGEYRGGGWAAGKGSIGRVLAGMTSHPVFRL